MLLELFSRASVSAPNLTANTTLELFFTGREKKGPLKYTQLKEKSPLGTLPSLLPAPPTLTPACSAFSGSSVSATCGWRPGQTDFL